VHLRAIVNTRSVTMTHFNDLKKKQQQTIV